MPLWMFRIQVRSLYPSAVAEGIAFGLNLMRKNRNRYNVSPWFRLIEVLAGLEIETSDDFRWWR